ncbi:RNA methylase [Spirochaeta thermophila DSM 6578]|uniref:RNA methylase n=1 Tax=Winmispira thermophila (strain ATCC 700085 / DSM 6578 / Z-1203) TaxID=869211 RepID=G0GDQ7_WINT7|nr:RNA methyltransferase [Spirochaeta thermophila]AEJ62187.1 RNA methylase [Spirochaeta thermophila DSM 6578]
MEGLPDYTRTPAFERRVRRHVKAQEHRIFVEGVEAFLPELEAELVALGYAPVREQGGFGVQGRQEDVYRLNLHLATASRVWLEVASFHATAAEGLFAGAVRVPWEVFLNPLLPIRVEARLTHSPIGHEGRAAGAVRDAVARRFREAVGTAVRWDEGTGGAWVQRVCVVGVRNRCRILLDTTGPALSFRGYRVVQGEAPLREHLAAGLVRRALRVCGAWPRVPDDLVVADLFCGSGTLAVEAAFAVYGVAPGRGRGFLFERMPWHREGAWGFVRRKAEGEAKGGRVIAGDVDGEAVEAARANASRAGVERGIRFLQRDFFALDAQHLGGERGLLVSNLPYGGRLPLPRDLHTHVLRHFVQVFPGWWGLFLLPSRIGSSFTPGLSVRLVARFNHGGIPVSAIYVGPQRVDSDPKA